MRLDRIFIILFCCIVFSSCENKSSELKPVYIGTYGDSWNVDLKKYQVSNDFVDKIADDIIRIKNKHNIKDNFIDEETAVDIAIATISYYDEDFFVKPTFYRISLRPDLKIYFISIMQEDEDPNFIDELTTPNLAISQQDGTVLAYWVN